MREAVTAIALSALALSTPAVAGDKAKRLFDVKAAIEMPRIVGPSGVNDRFANLLEAPDGEHAVLLLRKGDVASDAMIDELVLFRPTGTVEKPSGERVRTLAKMRYSQYWQAIQRVRWVDSQTVGFIGSRDGEPSQAFIADIRSGEIRQLTHSPDDVAEFAYHHDVVLYYVTVFPPKPRVMNIDNRQIMELDDVDQRVFFGSPTVALFREGLNGSPERLQIGPIVRNNVSNLEISLAPDGRYAVVTYPAYEVPDGWKARGYPRYREGDTLSRDPTSWVFWLQTRHYLIDVLHAKNKPLLDAPQATILTRGGGKVLWRADSRSVIVTDTYLPMSLSTEMPSQRPATVEISVDPGISPQLVAYDVSREKGSFPVDGETRTFSSPAALSWRSSDQALQVERPMGEGNLLEFYRYEAGSWHLLGVESARPQPQPRLRIGESFKQRQKLVASTPTCKCTNEVFDPAPAAAAYAFGRAESVRWTDSRGEVWRGGLLYPTNYVAGRRFPLVIQTHGYSENTFLINGPGAITTGMAGQPLANAGFFVLQVEDHAEYTGVSDEADAFADGYLAGLRRLQDRGLIDPAAVGIAAMSRTGLPVLNFLARHPKAAKAAVVADGHWWGFTYEVLGANDPEGLRSIREVTGGDPAENYQRWFTSNPIYRLSADTAALKVDSAAGMGKFFTAMEIYAAARRNGGVVDLNYFRNTPHNAFTPGDRMLSQGGAVDWFRFWLKGEEDPDPAKAEQYARWRKYRQDRDARLAKSPPAP